MEFHLITLFPEMFESPFRGGMIGRAIEQGLIAIKAHPLREHGLGNYRQVDDAPYGGGSGMAVIEAVGRMIPGVLGNPESLDEESFAAGMLEYPQYTRPEEFRGMKVPEILLSGDHGKIRAWRE